MATSGTLTRIYKITAAQWATLISGGSVNGQTYDPYAIYLIEQESSPITYDVID